MLLNLVAKMNTGTHIKCGPNLQMQARVTGVVMEVVGVVMGLGLKPAQGVAEEVEQALASSAARLDTGVEVTLEVGAPLAAAWLVCTVTKLLSCRCETYWGEMHQAALQHSGRLTTLESFSSTGCS